MAYNNFTLSKAKKDFDLSTIESENLFKDVGSIEPSATLVELLEEYLPLARAISTEKAKSELLVIPILVEIRKILSRKISLFSGSLFNVDISLGLTGYVDFLITLSEEMYAISSPVVTLVEAKNDLITSGIGQCVAEMVAAQIFNQKQDNHVSTIYGVVTTGTAWLFLKLEEKTVYIDNQEYYIDNLGKIMGILINCLEKAGEF
ncbi:hypothetical protein Riv7116_0823 [Rivularia sp. PCC 7116]|uniref:hypothetical protein n=1 Tax=Rivularia sp. PCC 7116 TaxID=373994 RepID=UPI00029F484E|nr:hypothetical protein [Rivularia sp. PCC 7116]AFY53408.1 hypothetical protein Riv7116_0823 [Rivularia sp. PCC 7116]